jgi:nitrate reductase gamma subunit
MVKKKVSKKMSKKRPVRRASSKSKKMVSQRNSIIGPSRAFRGLIIFAVLFVVSYLLYLFVPVIMYEDLFFLLSFVFGAICVALILSLVVYLIARRVKVKRR